MLNRTRRNENATGFKALCLVILTIPINIVMTLVSAFTGEDEARPSQVRAVVIGLLIAALALTLLVLSGSPRFQEFLK